MKKKNGKSDEKIAAFRERMKTLIGKARRVRHMILAALIVIVGVVFLLWYHLPMEIDETKPEFTPGASCSVFIYLCGSNLETKQGLAGKNIQELLSAEIPGNVNVVLETGGAGKWRSYGISNKKLQRYLVKDGELSLLEELPDASMGAPETLTDFLRWGAERYPAERSFFIFWDHGGSAAEGVCYDELHENDALSRSELMQAFADAHLPKKLDMVIFDACFMGSIETASIFKDYAYYMVGSQNVVPAGGLDYTFFAKALSGNSDEAFGRLLLDGFLEKCRKKKQDGEAQLSLLFLGAVEALGTRFDDACFELHLRQKAVDDYIASRQLVRKENVENSLISRSASDTAVMKKTHVNVVDLTNFLHSSFGIDLTFQKNRVEEAKKKVVLYEVHGDEVENQGLSLYFPIQYEREQLESYLEICPLLHYKEVLETIYGNVPTKTVEFTDSGSYTADGAFRISLTEESREWLASVDCRLWRDQGKKTSVYILLGDNTLSFYEDGFQKGYEELTFLSDFRGEWCFFGGTPLLTAVATKEKSVCYTAPVAVNGEDTEYSFRMVRNKEGAPKFRYGIVGAAFDEYGLPSRFFSRLGKGDEVVVYTAANEKAQNLRVNAPFTVGKDQQMPEISKLPEGRYRYQFVVTDIYGASFLSDYAYFEITENGKILGNAEANS